MSGPCAYHAGSIEIPCKDLRPLERLIPSQLIVESRPQDLETSLVTGPSF